MPHPSTPHTQRLTAQQTLQQDLDEIFLELGWDKLATRQHIHRLTLYHKLSDPGRQCPSYITELMPNTRAHDTNRLLRNANKHTTVSSRTTLYHNLGITNRFSL